MLPQAARRRRARRTALAAAAWSCVAAGVLMMVLGGMSCRWFTVRVGVRSRLEVLQGAASFSWNPRRSGDAPLLRGWDIRPLSPELRWRVRPLVPDYAMNPIGGWRTLVVPLWCVAAPLLSPAPFLVYARARRRRRAMDGRCSVCGYDRAGLARDGACPECGTPA
jgi:hypothetical protein